MQLSKWHVTSLSNGLDGLLIARAEQFNLILCGQDLPMVTSIEMVRSIRTFSMNQNTPVILLANGKETEEHTRIFDKLDARLHTMEEVEEMNFSNIL